MLIDADVTVRFQMLLHCSLLGCVSPSANIIVAMQPAILLSSIDLPLLYALLDSKLSDESSHHSHVVASGESSCINVSRLSASKDCIIPS